MLGLVPGATALSPEAAGIARAKAATPHASVLRPGFCLALGGNATAGRFVPSPWPQLLQRLSGRRVHNLARPHAGLDAMLGDQELLRVAALADLRLVEIPDAICLSNGFYTVHPRRNDRFLRAEPALTRLYPDVDFTQFSFTRHLVLALWAQDNHRFDEVRREVSARWTERMGTLLQRLGGRSVLIWWGNRPPLAPAAAESLRPGAPQLVDRFMLEEIRSAAEGLVAQVEPGLLSGRGRGSFLPSEVVAARELPGPESHAEMAGLLLPWMRLPKL